MPYFLALWAEALHLVDRTAEALEAIKEAEALDEVMESADGCRTAPASRCLPQGDGC